MSDSPRSRRIYGIIGIGIAGIIAIVIWFFSTWESETEQIVRDHDIIESNSLPASCLGFKDMMKCIISHTSDNSIHQSIMHYYRETLSVRNTLPPAELSTTCEQSLAYIQQQTQSLSGRIQTCLTTSKR